MEQYDRESPLFDRRLHVLVQYPDRDEKLQPLTIRLLNGIRQNTSKNQKERVFRVEITDDDGIDPYFLYLWSVSEEEFHDLKQQQRLLVDFPTFPSNLIELLQCCLKDDKTVTSEEENETSEKESIKRVEKQKEDQNKHATSRSQGPVPLSYLCVLNTVASATEHTVVFSIVETNPFKHLTHLSLQFNTGDDAAIKAYLAARLSQVNTEKRLCLTTLHEITAELTTVKQHERSLEKELEVLSQQSESTMAREMMKFSEELNGQRESASLLLKEREEEWSERLETMRSKYEEELKVLRAKTEASDVQLQHLAKIKYQQELQIEQLNTQTKELNKGSETAQSEVQALRAQNKTLDQRVFTQDKQINQLEMRVTALTQQVADKEEVITKTTELLQAAQKHKQEVEESLKMYRDNHVRLQQKLELSVGEINKGNDIIERIQGENRTLRSKMKVKDKILKQQEAMLNEKDHHREETVLHLKAARDDVGKRDEQIKSLKERIKELSAKLEESNQLLASNQQVITWLNKEINETQIAHHRRTTVNPQISSFRPSVKLDGISAARPFTASTPTPPLSFRPSMSTTMNQTPP